VDSFQTEWIHILENEKCTGLSFEVLFVDDSFLLRFIRIAKYSLLVAQQRLEKFCVVRSSERQVLDKEVYGKWDLGNGCIHEIALCEI
jgi:hypothetical protein